MAVWVERILQERNLQHSRAAETSLECECTCLGQIAWASSLAEPQSRGSGGELAISAEKPVPVGLVSEGQGRGRQCFGEKKVHNILPFCRWSWHRSLFFAGR